MPYDPGTQFLLDQMHDPNQPLHRRIDIAKFLIESRPEEFRGQRRNMTVIVIEGATPNAPVTVSFTLPGTSPFAIGHGVSVQGYDRDTGVARVTVIGAGDTPGARVPGDADDHSPPRLN
jgi:hypothetical protein